MKQVMHRVLKNDIFQFLMAGVIGYTLLTAVIISVLQVPPEAILDSGLDQILLVFEE